tara:strand:+ start:534 stop:875 length:342 start_codon:yes stop_codon:yes gene_type:complete
MGGRPDWRLQKQPYRDACGTPIALFMLVKVANKGTESVVTGLIDLSQRLPRELYKSLTWDRGKELADHPRLTMATDVDVYFCAPQSPFSADCGAIACRAMRGNADQMKIPTGC